MRLYFFIHFFRIEFNIYCFIFFIIDVHFWLKYSLNRKMCQKYLRKLCVSKNIQINQNRLGNLKSILSLNGPSKISEMAKCCNLCCCWIKDAMPTQCSLAIHWTRIFESWRNNLFNKSKRTAPQDASNWSCWYVKFSFHAIIPTWFSGGLKNIKTSHVTSTLKMKVRRYQISWNTFHVCCGDESQAIERICMCFHLILCRMIWAPSNGNLSSTEIHSVEHKNYSCIKIRYLVVVINSIYSISVLIFIDSAKVICSKSFFNFFLSSKFHERLNINKHT